jgi:transposase
MINKQTTRIHYTPHPWDYQVKLPIEIGMIIPADDSVRLLNMLMERIDYSKLYGAYERLARTETDPKNLFKVMVYGYMNWLYSSRKIERACQRDINFMYLLDGDSSPDHNTIARFRSTYLKGVVEDLFSQLVDILAHEGELSLLNIFVDGTKLEAFSNRYTFVWGKRVEKELAKLQLKMKQEFPKIAEGLGIRFWRGDEIETHQISKFLNRLQRKQKEDNIVLVHGRGTRKPPLQRAIEQVTVYLARQRKYERDIRILDGRNSYSKTDYDATFMRMKDDHMRNGQLKPGYNVTIGVDAEYIVDAMITQDRSDSKTLIPFLERIRRFPYQNIVGDAGFESEENYTHLEENGQLAFIKPSNHEQSKTKKYKSDIGRRENMPYDTETDSYLCHLGRYLTPAYEKKTKSAAGYPIVTTIYECESCDGCPHKEKCIKPGGKQPIEERTKRLQVSKTFLRQRTQAETRITSEEGILLRLNRSIQVEGSFGVLKEDMSFRRFLLRGKVKVHIEILLLCFAYNVKKFHNKIQSGRCGMFLHKTEAV